MVEVKITYATPVTMGIDLGASAGLPSSASLLAGHESDEVDNSSNLYIDALVRGFIKTGTTTADTDIYIYVWGNDETIATNTLDVLDGVDSVETLTDEGIRDSMLRLGAVIHVKDTTARTFNFQPFSVAALFGGILPKFWGLFVVHDTGANLDTDSATHVIKYTGVTYTSA